MSSCNAHIYPRITTHRGKPGYRSLTLTRSSHNPQHILNGVKEFTKHLDCNQQGHKKDFVRIYKRWISVETTNDADQLKDLRTDLVSAMGALDGFFFYKSLTANWRGQGNKAVMKLKFEGNIFSAGHCGYDARLRIQSKEDPKGLTSTRDGRTTIFIDAFKNGIPRTTMDIFETLLHEIAHAIFQEFNMWECESCNLSDPAVLGSYGHGLVWVGLFEHMRDTMRSWDRVLNNFSTDDLVWMHHWKP